MKAEERRLEEAQERSSHWRRWGPYLGERQVGAGPRRRRRAPQAVEPARVGAEAAVHCWFFEHFVCIAKAMPEPGRGLTLRDEEDGFDDVAAELSGLTRLFLREHHGYFQSTMVGGSTPAIRPA